MRNNYNQMIFLSNNKINTKGKIIYLKNNIFKDKIKIIKILIKIKLYLN
jgi:hypothetical protein